MARPMYAMLHDEAPDVASLLTYPRWPPTHLMSRVSRGMVRDARCLPASRSMKGLSAQAKAERLIKVISRRGRR